MSDPKPESPKKRSAKVGDLVEVKDGDQVVRPDGSVSTVHGTSYYLDVPGEFVVAGVDISVK